jgi:predicted NBD/HSP70 family sugar kinase
MQRNREQTIYLGIDIGGTKIQGAYLERGQPRLTAQVATPTSDYETFLAALQRIVEEVCPAGKTLAGLSIGLPGTVTKERVTWVPNLPFLNGRDLAGHLSSCLGIPVELANDAQLALLGESWRGAAQAYQNAILVSVGTGVGGALMLGGKIVRGMHGGAGAFGWLNLDWRETAHGEHGYVERHASGSALNNLARQLDPSLSSHQLIARARAGEQASLTIVQHFASLLGAACASIASILDPEALIIAGGLCEAFDLLAPALQTQMHALASPGVRELPILAALLGKDAAAYGALRAAMPPRIHWT